MDLLANIEKTYVGSRTGLVYHYKPMTQALRNYIQQTLVTDALVDRAAGENREVVDRKISDSLVRRRVEHNLMTVRSCFVGITGADGERVNFNGTDLKAFPRVVSDLGGLPSTLVDHEFLGTFVDSVPDAGVDLWDLCDVIHKTADVNAKKN